ncbi:MAG: prepilin-type N-terminal cleavage/methylation domain-containing protein [Polyangiaceae bacterium]|nr:prepilin-type N-terminal cleavage/methylation domain-containing protein [Polyangiaceae bacterium]
MRALTACGARTSGARSAIRTGALQRGVTLIEVMIVVAILALVAGGVAVFAMPKFQQAQDTTAKTAAQTIRQAVQSYKTTDTEGTCPTVAQLVQAKELDPGQQTVDPWGEDFVITCTDDDVIVLSKGRDKKQGTKDDIQVPKGVAASAAD